jgi:hypothetical protein
MPAIENLAWVTVKKFTTIQTLIVLLGLSIVLVYLSAFLSGEHSIVYAHDSLDSNFVFVKVLVDSHALFASNHMIIPGIMGGLPRAVYPGELSVITVLYAVLKPYQAYILNEVFMHLVAFAGMYLLLLNYIFTERKVPDVLLSVTVATAFAVLPFYTWGGLGIAGQPLALYAFLNVKNRTSRLADWAIVIVIPFYSSLILTGMFFLAMIAIIFVYDFLKARKINYPFMLAIGLMLLGYLVTSYRMFLSIFDPVFISHRTEFFSEPLNFWNSILSAKDMLLNGQFHAHSLHNYFILPFILLAFVVLVVPARMQKYAAMLVGFVSSIGLILNFAKILDWSGFIASPTLTFYYCGAFVLLTAFLFIKKMTIEGFLALGLLLIAVGYGLWSSEFLVGLKNSIPFLKQIQFDRFYFLNALFWFLLFACMARALYRQNSYLVVIVLFFVASQIQYSFTMRYAERFRTPVAIDDYYKKELFDQVKSYINRPLEEFRVVSIGFDPIIAAYNGFYTLDGYATNYPLSYKHEFRKIMSKELDKNEAYRKYFDFWGSRCYIFIAEDMSSKQVMEDVSLDLEQLKAMGGEYIFSYYLIQSTKASGLSFLNKFSASNQDLYLYKVE